MIWTAERNMDQGALVTSMYERAGPVPCERKAIMAGGLPGADTARVLRQAGIDASRYLTINIDAILAEIAARRLIPHVDGLTPLEAADLAHAEAQFLAKRLGMRALADDRNVIWDISFASQHAVESWIAAHRRAGYTIRGMFVELSIQESVRRSAAMHRRGHDDYRQGRGYGGRFIPAGAIRALADDTGSRPVRDGVPGAPDAPYSARDPGVPGDVTTMIRAYLAGEMTLKALAGRFRSRHWRAVPPVTPPGMEEAAAAIDDPEPYVPGSFDDVVRAYDLRWITDPDYEALAAAAAVGIQGQRGDPRA
ncbi:MAG: zeta toxin family protein [Streptosporangiaceae bacterium]